MSTTILLGDKSTSYSQKLSELLHLRPDLRVVGICDTNSQLIKLCIQYRPKIIIIDSQLCEFGECDSILYINQCMPQSKVIVLVSLSANEGLSRYLKAGAKAILLKDVNFESLINVISLVLTGEVVISGSLVSTLTLDLPLLLQRNKEQRTTFMEILSRREKTILTLASRGFTNKAIADSLYISEYTVKVHMRNVMEKLGVHNRQQAIAAISDIQLFI